MILVDTSVWVDHLRVGDPHLVSLLDEGNVVIHPFVIGEIALGTLAGRNAVLALLQDLPSAPVADSMEVLLFIERNAIAGRGIGYVDLHLLASASLSADITLWTRDRRLGNLAETLGCAHGHGSRN